MLDQALSTGLSLSDSDRETLWKGFFRNALPLLFKNTNWNWIVCEKCEQWLIPPDENNPVGCMFCDNKKLRPIKWEDFRK